MNRKLFLKRIPTYQQDPSFYAERCVGTLSNVYKQTITTNGNYQQQGAFTGFNITVNVSDSVPICDRVKMSSSVVMLSSFLVGTGGTVTVPASNTIVIVRDRGTYFQLIVRSSSSTTSTYTVTSGALYYVFSFSGYEVEFRNAVSILMLIYDVASNNNDEASVKVYPSIMTFTV